MCNENIPHFFNFFYLVKRAGNYKFLLISQFVVIRTFLLGIGISHQNKKCGEFKLRKIKIQLPCKICAILISRIFFLFWFSENHALFWSFVYLSIYTTFLRFPHRGIESTFQEMSRAKNLEYYCNNSQIFKSLNHV